MKILFDMSSFLLLHCGETLFEVSDNTLEFLKVDFADFLPYLGFKLFCSGESIPVNLVFEFSS